jgi:NAD(P)-dependent dehydrogenase (short-subunit alcohol dehydrogenase family)
MTDNFQFNFINKTALVTGGVSGIGAATALAFKKAGAKVIVTGLTSQEIETAASNPDFSGIDIHQLDVTDSMAISKLASQIGTLDYLIHCAGMILRDAEHEPDNFDKVLNVNVSGGMRVTHALKPLLIKSKGAIVFIGSIMSIFGGPKQPAYSASKGAIKNLAMSLGAAYAADGIRVNAIAPGFVLTNLSKGARDNQTRNQEILSRTPMARWADTAEIADPILFLCSDAARYITGTLLIVDGGYSSQG